MNHTRILRSSLKMMLSGCLVDSFKSHEARRRTNFHSSFRFRCLVDCKNFPVRPRDFPPFPLPFPQKRSPPLCRARYRPIFLYFPPIPLKSPIFSILPPFSAISLDTGQRNSENRTFSEKKSRKVLSVREKAVPLHSLSGKRYC